MINDTEDFHVVNAHINNITAAGSAFATTTSGESLFINARIVEALKLSGSDVIRATVTPNFPDKRDRVQWRALRVKVTHSFDPDGDLIEESVVEEEPKEPLDKRVVEALDEHGPLRTSVIARLLEENSGAIGTMCAGLFSKGTIAMAEVYSGVNKRASHRVWAIDINDFDVDPFDVGDQS